MGQAMDALESKLKNLGLGLLDKEEILNQSFLLHILITQAPRSDMLYLVCQKKE
jgi:hypothetical protein